MAKRHGRSKPRARLRCEALELRDTPAAVTVIDFGSGFAQAGSLRGLPGGWQPAPDLLLTDGPGQARAAWSPARVHVGAFETSFVFRLDGGPGPLGDGLTFALTGNEGAIGQPGGAGGGLGYQGLPDSVAVKFDLFDNAGEGANSVGLYTGGADPTAPAVSLDGTPIDLHAGHPVRADLRYDGAALTLTLTDTTAPDRPWTHAFDVDVPAAVGSPTAYAGFTAGTGALSARQAVESWTFAEQASPAPVSQPPQVTTPARVSWVAPSMVAVSARVTDDGGPAGLTYAWDVVSAPNGQTRRLDPWPGDPAWPTAVVHLDMGYGLYTFRLTVRDAEGQTATSEVSYDSGTIVQRLDVTPAAETVVAGEAVQFTAVEYDPAGNRIGYPLAPGWSVVEGPGTIDEAGRYAAPAGAAGTATIQAVVLQPDYRGMHYEYVGGRATVTILPSRPPEITSLTAQLGQCLGEVSLRAVAKDDGGAGGLTYAWAVASAPTGAAPRIDARPGDPAAATARVDMGGDYTFGLTVRDADGLTATGEVTVHYPTCVRSLGVSPGVVTVPAGVLDLAFHGSGFTVLPVGTSGASALAVQPDGKVILAGLADTGGKVGIGVVRLGADGYPDPTFPVWVRVGPPGAGIFGDVSVALQPDGKIVVAGTDGGLGNNVFVARLNPDGSPDPSFGAGGRTTFGFGPAPDDRLGGLALQPDGRIVVGGYSRAASGSSFAAARLTADGQLDPEFGAGGATVIPNGDPDRPVSVGGEVAVQPDGRILLAGTAESPSDDPPRTTSDAAVLRLLPDGRPDETFGEAGRLVMDWGSPEDRLAGLALQPDGKVVLAGDVTWGGVPGREFAAVRLTPAGAMDPTFGAGGRVVLGVGPGQDAVTGVAVLPNRDVVLAGSVMNDFGRYEIGAVLLFPDGTPDPAFDYDGRAVVPNDAYSRGSPVPLPGESFARAGVAATPAGGFVVAGAAPSPAPVGTAGFAAVRFAPPGAPPSDVTLWHRPVPENSPPGTLVGYLQAFDPDVGHPFTFSLVDGAADNARFRIRWNMVLTGETFDYEARARYTVRVRVTDATGRSLEKDLAVNVGDEPEVAAGTDGPGSWLTTNNGTV